MTSVVLAIIICFAIVCITSVVYARKKHGQTRGEKAR